MSEKKQNKAKEPRAFVQKPAYIILTIAFGAIMTAGIVMAFINFKAVHNDGIVSVDKMPLIVSLALTVVGVIGMSVSIGLSIRLLIKYDRELSAARENFSIDPAVLRDQRIRELPEVKKLMKHENIKRIFSAEKVSAADLSDPHVQLLIDALLARADENGVIRFE